MDAIHLPPGITLPTAFGAPAQPFQPGQVIQALVLELLESGAFRLQLPQAIVDVRSDVALTPGSTVTLAVKGTGANAKLVIYADNGAPLAPNAAGQGDAALAQRRPLGEAVIIGRAVAAAPARVSPEPVVRDVPSTVPVRAPVAPSEVSPARAVSDAVRAAAPRQSGLGPLFADVEQVVTTNASLPAPVRAAASTLLALRVPLDETLSAADVKQALTRSGALFEPHLAANTLSPGNDLKAALLVLRQVLKAWSASEPAPVRAPVSLPAPAAPTSPASLASAQADPARPLPQQPSAPDLKTIALALAGAADEMAMPAAPLSAEQATTLARIVAGAMTPRDAPLPAAPGPNGPPPPYRGAPLSAQPQAAPSIAPDATPREAAERLLAETDGALARQTLLQAASLPDQPDLPGARSDPAVQRWSFEIPFVTPQGTNVAQFEVSRDGRAATPDAPARVWRARFSLDIEPMGPVHALVAIAGERASVTLWAERLSTVTRLNENAPMLNEALRAAELEPSEFLVRVGAPPVAAKPAAPGRFMDRAS